MSTPANDEQTPVAQDVPQETPQDVAQSVPVEAPQNPQPVS